MKMSSFYNYFTLFVPFFSFEVGLELSGVYKSFFQGMRWKNSATNLFVLIVGCFYSVFVSFEFEYQSFVLEAYDYNFVLSQQVHLSFNLKDKVENI